MGNSPWVLGWLLAIWQKGAVPILLDRSCAGPAREGALATAGARAWLGWKDSETDVVRTAAGCHLEKREGAPFIDGTQFLKLTSGTTGAPRAIRFTAAQLLADGDAIYDTMGFREEDVNFGVIPWSHSYGFSNLVTPLLCRGLPVVATEDRLPRAILAELERTGTTIFPGLPVFFQKLADLDASPLPRLRLCISAGAPLSAAVASAFRARFGVKVHSFYGSSECGGIAYDASEAEVPEGCVGPPMRGVTLEYQDDEDPTRIRVRGAAVGTGYFPGDDEAILGDGAFTPGDLVRRTAEGLVLAGRVSDFINVAGRKLNPTAVEAVLRSCPGVCDAIVFGVPHPIRGEEPIACVAGTATAEALQALCARELSAWQVPRDFWLVVHLPVNERGKLNRRGLAEAYRARMK
jgi:long-chain acyl-CoA synthetase